MVEDKENMFIGAEEPGEMEINSLAPGRCGSDFDSIIFKHIQNSTLGTHYEIAAR